MGTWIAAALVAAIIGFALYTVLRDKKNGKGCNGCCEGCRACPASEKTTGDRDRP